MVTQYPQKMSEVMKEMAEQLLRDPDTVQSSEVFSLALMFANFAWNECTGLDYPRESYSPGWEAIEARDPNVWDDFKSTDIDELIDELVEYKRQHFPEDQRRILVCGFVRGSVKVKWLPPAAPGVDSRAEMRLYSLVLKGQREEAMRFMQDSQQLSRQEAQREVARMAQVWGEGLG